jgi:carboxylesterase type B
MAAVLHRMFVLRVLVCYLLLPGGCVCLVAAVWSHADDDETVVTVAQGKIRGVLASSGSSYIYRAFRGIPFAEPPVGDLRFQPPQPKVPWHPALLPAHEFQSECTQRWPREKYPTGAWDDVEDCLYLNVYTPRRNDSRPPPAQGFPVWLYVHGGANEAGSAIADGTGGLLDPHWLYADGYDNVVVVTVQYRLNVFGFLGGRELQASTSDGSVGNFGLQDQRLAMAWTRQNVASFGGNPRALFLFGESTGVRSSCCLPASALCVWQQLRA